MVYGRVSGDKVIFRENFSSSFDGSTSFSYKDSFLSNSSNFSIHLDITPNVDSTRQVIFSFGDLSTNTVVFDIGISSNNKLFFYDGTTETEVDVELSSGVKYKADFVYSDSAIFVYFNNDLTSTGFSIDDDINYNDIVIGESVDGTGEYYNGSLENVSVFSKSLNYKDVNVISGGSNVWTPAAALGDNGIWWEADSGLTYNTQPTLVDGDMEAVGTAAWTVSDSILTKELGTRTGGAGTQVLRIAYVNPTFWAKQDPVILIGNRYRIQMWGRSSGVPVPEVVNTNPGATTLWTGVASNDWQELDTTFSANGVGMFFGSADASGYVEFDDITLSNRSLTQWSPRAATGALAGSVLGQATDTAMPWDDDGIRGDGGDGMEDSAAASVWSLLHQASTTFWVVTRHTDDAGYVYDTLNGSPTNVGQGVVFTGSGVIGARSSDGLGVVAYPLNEDSAAAAFAAGRTGIVETVTTPIVLGTSASFDLLVDGVSVASDASYLVSSANPETPINTLRRQGGTEGNMTIHEGVVVLGTPSASTRTRLRNYLAAKHGITLP
jgi:hypothetical protein